MTSGPFPSQVTRMTPGLVSELFATSPGEPPWLLAPCSATDTVAGDRAVIYESGGRGVVGLFDFASNPFDDGTGQTVAWGAAVEFETPVARKTLLADRATSAVFERVNSGCSLEGDVRDRVIELCEPLPAIARGSGNVPALGTEDLLALGAVEQHDRWASETEMQQAIAADEQSCTQLGLSAPCPTEVWFDDREARFDLFCEALGAVVECKLFATPTGLEQLDGYLERLRARHSDRDWRGRLVVADGYQRDVVKAIAPREDLELWVCLKRRDGTPLLERIEGVEHLAPTSAVDLVADHFAQLLGLLTDSTECALTLANDAGVDTEDLEALEAAVSELLANAGPQENYLDQFSGRDRDMILLSSCLEFEEHAVAAIELIARVAGVPDSRLEALHEHDAEGRRNVGDTSPRDAVAYVAHALESELPVSAMVFASRAGVPVRRLVELSRDLDGEDDFQPLDGTGLSSVDRMADAYVRLRNAAAMLLTLAETLAEGAELQPESLQRNVHSALDGTVLPTA